ncbi:MAG TPA: ABC transporter ATP-binding protein [Candidatus Saccharimonadales bacterium]|nr:ABC transporter ATP-binding protein [Candidatus Saccharimonadales bacterium]
MATPLVELRDVRKVYNHQGSVALDSVSLTIPAGQAACIMGPSGSGKSTLLNVIGGLDRPSAGMVVVAGHDLRRMSETSLARFRRTQVGIVFQFFNLLNNLSALDNAMLPAQLAGVKRDDARRRALDLFERLDIAPLRDKYPMLMSGGQRQRVAIARALINNPALLLADEPTGALDSHSGEQVMAILGELNRSGQTVIIVTHDERIAAANATRVVHLVDGVVASDRAQPTLSMVQAR